MIFLDFSEVEFMLRSARAINPTPMPAKVPRPVALKYMPVAMPINMNPRNIQFPEVEKMLDFIMMNF
jgi:hypothetical protein